MKRVIAALLSLSLCFALCSCKSRKATAADNMILDIGEVTLNSENDIVQAENAVNALKETDYEQLEHLETLKKARAFYDDLVNAHKQAQKEAEKAFYNSKAKDVIQKIDAIGTVTLESEAAISDAQKAFNNLGVYQDQVSNIETLRQAKETLKALKDKQEVTQKTPKQSQSPKENTNPKADQRTINISGKQVWKVYAKSSELHFTGNFNGSGYFGIKILDSNQDFFDLVVNEIGDYIIDKTIYGLVPDEMYYIQIECTEGSWSCSWTGTYGR